MSADAPQVNGGNRINFKGILANFCQTKLKRSCNRDDIVYTTEKQDDKFQSSVKLTCFDGQEFKGEPCSRKKDAEQAVAQQVLVEMVGMPPAAKEDFLSSKAPRAAANGSSDGAEASQNTALPASQRSKKGRAIDPNCEGSNPKTELVSFCQAACGRTMTKEDVAFTIAQEGKQFKAIVRLVCLEDKAFEGTYCPSRREAEQSAAMQALLAHSSEIEKINEKRQNSSSSDPTAAGGQRAGRRGGGAKSRKAIDISGDYSNPKTELTAFCQWKCNKCLAKGDISYTAAQVGELHQVTVKLSCMGGEEWVGDAKPTAKEAEFAAARQVLKAYEREILAFNVDAVQWTSEMRLKVPQTVLKEPKEPRETAVPTTEKLTRKKKERPPSGPGLARESVDVGIRQGELLEWKGTYGWIKPEKPIEHPLAEKHKGRIYVHQADVQGEVSAMVPGCTLQFSVYEDASGLGATDVATL